MADNAFAKLQKLAEHDPATTSMKSVSLTDVELGLIWSLRNIRYAEAGSSMWNAARDQFYALTSGKTPPRGPHAVELAKVARKWLFMPTTTEPRTPERKVENELHEALLKFMTAEGFDLPSEIDALTKISKVTRDWPAPKANKAFREADAIRRPVLK